MSRRGMISCVVRGMPRSRSSDFFGPVNRVYHLFSVCKEGDLVRFCELTPLEFTINASLLRTILVVFYLPDARSDPFLFLVNTQRSIVEPCLGLRITHGSKYFSPFCGWHSTVMATICGGGSLHTYVVWLSPFSLVPTSALGRVMTYRSGRGIQEKTDVLEFSCECSMLKERSATYFIAGTGHVSAALNSSPGPPLPAITNSSAWLLQPKPYSSLASRQIYAANPMLDYFWSRYTNRSIFRLNK
ncbi:uncharacterized protein BT62DRAFT_1011028 [Guyanagaster necrorhizus]|uniref:Uncharacterized protein n=1 Tax=Guyanagaster necrorhizus TaxID=856835 RepID=A0A9P7VKF7_9AGAR|nr:uncharacterized protein BT62DRAFT_1011028 [Guyanagaster necrorhizus MCA 3950]KAG7441990.1 hypothetical protein BT62DRAFT_1011028 [Guyanagaster necrorhizus MCA 3950]